ncbi:MAG: hypothetical protein GDA36_08760 [Rhodobacteraceae bacterium]|nr:hypothetical protein [Paracoccaceae bacterium]
MKPKTPANVMMPWQHATFMPLYPREHANPWKLANAGTIARNEVVKPALIPDRAIRR